MNKTHKSTNTKKTTHHLSSTVLVVPFTVSAICAFILVIAIAKFSIHIPSTPHVLTKPSMDQLFTSKLSKTDLTVLKNYVRLFFFDPMVLINAINKSDFDKTVSLVDVRPKEAFVKKHIKHAVSFPFDSTNTTQFLESAKKLKNKKIVLYGSSASDANPKEAAFLLLDHGFDVYVLAIGTNEFFHLKALWVPEDKWDTINPEDYRESSLN